MTLLAGPRGVPAEFEASPALNNRGHVMPLKSDKAPTRINSRRLTPSHRRVRRPSMLSMMVGSWQSKNGGTALACDGRPVV